MGLASKFSKVRKRTVKYYNKHIVAKTQVGRNYLFTCEYYDLHGYGIKESKENFVKVNREHFYCEPLTKTKGQQFKNFLSRIDICPIKGYDFFYSIDVWKGMQHTNPVLMNHSLDYDLVVNSSFEDIANSFLRNKANTFVKDMLDTIEALKEYYNRCIKDEEIGKAFKPQLEAIESLWHRPARSLFEAFQRILFINQFMWQTGHNDIGLGHLDWVLDRVYKEAEDKGKAEDYILQFFSILHENYIFKSAVMPGDTGQYILLGGLESNHTYKCNELTYMFLNCGIKVKAPDPKTILRYSACMPEDLFDLALSSIESGIGAPLLSNDDEIICDLISSGVEETDAYKYATSACWEPLIPQKSCDSNNAAIVNYAQPLVDCLENTLLEKVDSFDKFKIAYEASLEKYLSKMLKYLSRMEYEEDLLLSIFSENSLERMMDINHGGAVYSNIGVTTAGMESLINSLLNIDRIVYKEKSLSFQEFNELRKKDFEGNPSLQNEIKNIYPRYGSDDEKVVELTKWVVNITSDIFSRYKTVGGGNFKFGLSSPGYVIAGKSTPATFDGRKNGDPFGVHISSSVGLPLTEVLSFSTKLDYSGNRYNGNVVDIMFTPTFIKDNKEKIKIALKVAFANGLFQIQINVFDSSTLIEAKSNPEKFPNLIVRVWGFSAYFNDLPDEYKDLLIARALETEKAYSEG